MAPGRISCHPRSSTSRSSNTDHAPFDFVKRDLVLHSVVRIRRSVWGGGWHALSPSEGRGEVRPHFERQPDSATPFLTSGTCHPPEDLDHRPVGIPIRWPPGREDGDEFHVN